MDPEAQVFVKNRQAQTEFAALQSAGAPAERAAPPPEPVNPLRSASRNRERSILSADLVVKGTLIAAGDVQLEGKLEGDVRARGLIVGETATIIGDIYAEEATIRGRIEGNIGASKIQLCSTCHVEGNLLPSALSIELGAYFEGNCRHPVEELKQTIEDLPPPEHEAYAPVQSLTEESAASLAAPSSALQDA